MADSGGSKRRWPVSHGKLGAGKILGSSSSLVVSNGEVREGGDESQEGINPPENIMLEGKSRVPRAKPWVMGKY